HVAVRGARVADLLRTRRWDGHANLGARERRRRRRPIRLAGGHAIEHQRGRDYLLLRLLQAPATLRRRRVLEPAERERAPDAEPTLLDMNLQTEMAGVLRQHFPPAGKANVRSYIRAEEHRAFPYSVRLRRPDELSSPMIRNPRSSTAFFRFSIPLAILSAGQWLRNSKLQSKSCPTMGQAASRPAPIRYPALPPARLGRTRRRALARRRWGPGAAMPR